MRHQIGLSPVGAATFVGASFTHLLFWIFILLSYTGYIKGDPDAKNNSNKWYNGKNGCLIIKYANSNLPGVHISHVYF